ncbi:MAG: hypothetical protein E7397_04945 [Ruminococcaceae bacterium]|nr:hypothetical protein [Oscillospiraceae bacterium]
MKGEVSLLFLGYNLKRVMNIIGNTELIRYFKDRTKSMFSKLIRFVLILTAGKLENSMVLFSA